VDRLDLLRRLKDGYVAAATGACAEVARDHQDALRFVMEPFFRDVVLELYLLLKDSRFESAGFALPKVAQSILQAQLTGGLRRYRAAIARASWRTVDGGAKTTSGGSTRIAAISGAV
jgi:hypothetical protein